MLSTTTEDSSPCLVCGQSCATRCSQCKTFYFCGKECQKKVWKSHKSLCKAISSPTLAKQQKIDDNESAPSSQQQKCLIVDGLGPCGPGWDYVKGAKQELLAHGVTVAVVDATMGNEEYFPKQMALLLQNKNKSRFVPTAILVVGWGSGKIPEHWNTNRTFQQALKDWCHKGGNFLVQGERISLCDNWPRWFDKEWKDYGYFRTIHQCFAAGPGATHWCPWFRERYADARPTYNVKACMINNVPPEEVLYGTTADAVSHSLVPHMAGVPIEAGCVAVAYGQYGQGTVSFFGDVNHEERTLDLMALIARGY